MKNLFIIIIAYTAFNLSSEAQISVYWIGGKAGRPTDWNCAANWSNNKVPNEFTDVFIMYKESNKDCFPEIIKGNFKIHSLSFETGTHLKIHKEVILTILKELNQKIDLQKMNLEGNLVLKFLKNQDIAENKNL